MNTNNESALLKSIDGETMSLLGVTANGSVRGLLMEMAVEQRYRNASETNVEVVYTFPLPYDATLLDVEVRLGERTLRAVVVERKAAEARYEDALEKGDTAVMLERGRDGLCTMNLGNLMAGETATIRYTYAQLLRVTHGSVRIAVPTVIAPRYGDPAAAGLAPQQAPLTDLCVAYPFALTLALEGDIAAGTLESPSHAIGCVRTDAGVTVTLSRDGWLDRDFILEIGGLEGRSLATLVRDGDAYVALASFVAPAPADEAQAPLALKLLVDCSGSMGGDSIAAAKRALHAIIASLAPSDRFTLSQFGSQTRHELGRFVAASADVVRRAAAMVGAMNADLGGTEMETALSEVFALGDEAAGATAADVLVITDGEVYGADALAAAARRARQRVFVVGIGSAPAEGVLRALADTSGGVCEFVAPNEDAEAAILRMFARLRAPRIDRVDVAWPQPAAWSTPLPSALFGGETIHAFAGFDAPLAGTVTLHMHALGERSPLAASAAVPAVSDGITLARIAAARRIEHADTDEALALALRYGLLTDRTNLIVVAERAADDKAVDLPALQRIAQMHAAGWGGVGSVANAPAVAMRQSVKMRNVFAGTAALDLSMSVSEARSPAAPGRMDDIGFLQPSNRDFAHEDVIPYTAEAYETDSLLDDLARHLPLAGRARLPSTIEALCRRGLDDHTADVLRALVADGHREEDVVRAFLEYLATQLAASGKYRRLRRALRGQFRDANECEVLRMALPGKLALGATMSP